MERKINQQIEDINAKIAFYIEKMVIEKCPYIRNYYGFLIKNEMVTLIDMISNKHGKHDKYRQPLKEFTAQELAEYDGSNGRPAYVAVNGNVYDMSRIPSWGGGTHFSLYAGRDLTKEFSSCHMAQSEILDTLPKVGVLRDV